MLRFDPLEFLAHFRKPGGLDFTLFMNKLIEMMCLEERIPVSEISTCSRTDAKDGGVDTRVRRGAEHSVTGYLTVPTIFQFRAADEAHFSKEALIKEVNKWRAKKCIEEGHGYRLCVCDNVTDGNKTKWEEILSEAVLTINPSAPEPRLLNIDDIARLANAYSPLVMSFRPDLQSRCKLFDRWGASITDVTRIFIPSSTFESTRASILAHLDFAAPPPDAVLPIHGLSGVGKTRTLYECLRSVPQADGLVLYTDDEDRADELATLLVNEATVGPTVLVVDDCSLSVRLKLQKTLRGFRGHLRCICIGDGTEVPRSAAAELNVSKLSSVELEKILKENFPGVPFDRVRTYAYLADGFVRLAADMCQYDGQIKTAGNISPVMQGVGAYYQERLTDRQRRAVEAVSLLKRVKRRGEEHVQLDSLCRWLGEDRRSIEEEMAAVKDSPGFVETGALYYKVTPEIIAMVAFEKGWKRWGEGREDSLLSSIPDDIREAFLERVSESAGPEVRNTVRLFFRRFADSFSPEQLSHPGPVKTLISLIETDPVTYLPLLRRVVFSATREQLTSSQRWVGGDWGPRRQLVWLAEGFAQFREFFPDAEAILFHLALNECEPDIGNNATNIWQRLFCMQMSGTPLPFADRLRLLEERLSKASDMTGDLMAGAVRTIFNFHATRLLGAPVIGGRIPERDWYPESQDAYRLAIREGLLFLTRVTRHPVPAIAREARSTLVSDVEVLTRLGWLDDVRELVTQLGLDEDSRAKLVSDLKYFLVRRKAPDDQDVPKTYLDKVEAWIQELAPDTLHGRLVEQVGANPWSHYGREKEWELSLTKFAQELLRDQASFAAELPWLLSVEARSAFEFGNALGSQDSEGHCLEAILTNSTATEAALARGYVSGLIYRAKSDGEILNKRLDHLEQQDALLSFQIAHAAGNAVNVLERAIRLVTEGKLPAYNLRNFTFWVGDRHITNVEVLRLIGVLMLGASAGDHLCCDVILDFLGARLHSGRLSELLSLNEESVWQALAVVTEFPSREAYWWANVLKAASPTNPSLAVHLACQALVSDNFQFSDEAKNLVAYFGTSYPEQVMEEVGKVMLSSETGWNFLVGKYPIFTSMPPKVVIAWLDQHGVEASRKIARHLPQPYLDDGKPTLPVLTEYVLRRFENDDHTFNEFCAGSHSLQFYMGDIARTREQEAEMARPFLNHELRRVREWAQREIESGARDAQFHREHMDEIGL